MAAVFQNTKSLFLDFSLIQNVVHTDGTNLLRTLLHRKRKLHIPFQGLGTDLQRTERKNQEVIVKEDNQPSHEAFFAFHLPDPTLDSDKSHTNPRENMHIRRRSDKSQRWHTDKVL
jgi:hypothetical protein